MGGLPRGDTILHCGLLVGGDVFAYALAVGLVFCLVRPLHGRGQAKPVIGLHIVALHAHAYRVKQPQRSLRTGVSLVCCFAVPGERILIAFRNSFAV